MRILLAFLVALSVTAVSHGQFTLTPGGTQNSAGAFGDAGNSVFTGTYTGPNALFGSFTFTGTLNSTIPATFAAEAGLDLFNTTSGFGSVYFPSDLFDTFTTIDISRTHGGLFWFNQNDQLRVETFEDFDDGAGTDSQWTNLSLTFNNSVSATVLGPFDEGTSFLFDTFGADYDTEIALYTSDGVLIDTNDDSGAGLQSAIDVGQLAVGDYILVVGGWDSFFGDGFAIAGGDFGNYLLNLNGNNIALGGSTADQFASFRFSVFAPVPEPATFALVAGVGGIALACRRFRRQTVA